MQLPFDLNLMNLKRHDSRELTAMAEAVYIRNKNRGETRLHWRGLQTFGSSWKFLIERAVGRLFYSHP